jgi:23S rRNA (adenine2030-N6)-methyltransferase
MSTPPSRYRTEGAPDYSHRFHAGNVGDVWKHCVLLDVLRRAAAAGGRVAYVDTHAGEGRYPLAATGEWTEGIGRLWDLKANATMVTQTLNGDAVDDYLAICRPVGGGCAKPLEYPGSPWFAISALGKDASQTLYERDEQACERLRSAVRGDARVTLECGDGLRALPDALFRAEKDGARTSVALIDPPYTEKADWIAVPDVMIAAAKAAPRATVMLWYPVKSLTRPNAMIARIEAAGVHATLVELITTPLTHQRQRLNGSGMILVQPPEGTLESVAAAAARIGPLCATRNGAWSFRAVAW